MAIITAVTGQHMGGVLASCPGTVVASGTTGGGIAVVKHRTGEGVGIVAVLADIAALDMAARSAQYQGSIMAT